MHDYHHVLCLVYSCIAQYSTTDKRSLCILISSVFFYCLCLCTPNRSRYLNRTSIVSLMNQKTLFTQDTTYQLEIISAPQKGSGLLPIPCHMTSSKFYEVHFNTN